MNGSVWTTLAAAIVGGLIAVVGGTVLEMIRDERKAAQLSHAIAGEIKAVLEIIEARQYRAAVATYLQRAREGDAQILRIHLQQKYFAVIQANLQFIGLLPVELPILIPRFLNVANSGIEDVNGLSSGHFDSFTAPQLADLYAGLDQVLAEVTRAGKEIISLVAAMYGSPHNRYPLRVKLRKFRRRTVGRLRRNQQEPPSEPIRNG
jgi:hypothetical protein